MSKTPEESESLRIGTLEGRSLTEEGVVLPKS